MKGNEIFLEALRKDTEMWDAFTGKNENPNLVSSKYEGNDRQKIMVPAVSEYLTITGTRSATLMEKVCHLFDP